MKNILILATMIIGIFANVASANDNCFASNDLPDSITGSIVYIFSYKTSPQDGIEGTGFVGPNHKIYTARHVIENNENIMVNNSRGELIGYGRIDPSYTPDKSGNFVTGDSVRLNIVSFNPDDEEVARDDFQKMEPLSIAHYAHDMMATIPGPGVSSGISGAPILNANHEVIGVLSASTTAEDFPHVHMTFSGHKTAREPQGGSEEQAARDALDVPVNGHIYIAPLDKTSSVATPEEGDITVAGFPHSYCMIFHGHMTTLMASKTKLVSFKTSVDAGK